VPLAALVLDPGNVREHPAVNVNAIAASLTRFGQQKPVVQRPSDGVVLAGNGMVLAARGLGWTHLAAAPWEPRSAGEARAFAIADNRSADLAIWNEHEVRRQLTLLRDAGVDLAAIGWEPEYLEGEWSPDRVQPVTFSLPGDPIPLTAEERASLESAVKLLRRRLEDPRLTEGRACELLAADYLAGA
jgi:hypothetical protein